MSIGVVCEGGGRKEGEGGRGEDKREGRGGVEKRR